MSPKRPGRRQVSGAACPRRISRFVEPALLLLLHRLPGHGYALIEGLRSLGLERYPIDSSAIYRALRRLENGGMVRSGWDTETEAGPPRRVYAITALGEDCLAGWVEDLKATVSVLHVFLDAYQADVVGGRLASPEHPLDSALRSIDQRASSLKEADRMKVVVSSEGPGLEAPTSPIFGRCPMYVFVDTETMDAVSVSNPAQNTPGGAGIEAARFVLSRGAGAVLAGNVGPNASAVLSEAGVAVYLVAQSTVGQAVDEFKSGKQSPLSGAEEYCGSRAAASSGRSGQVRAEELASLAAEAAELRKRLAVIMTRISELEKES